MRQDIGPLARQGYVLRGPESFEDHGAYAMSDVWRNNEVNIKYRTVDEQGEFNSAKRLEADQWISNA
eukprot:11165460-Lingulodinium_polyedra.AAC.1